MEDLGNIISKNLIYLRKKASLTQLEFGERVNYSDKTVSKWELGTVIPSVETLKEIADFYGVSMDYIVTEHRSQKEYDSSIGKTINAKNRITMIALVVSIIWVIAVVIYCAGYINYKTVDPNINRYWIAFVWGLPLSFLVMSFLTNRYFKGNKWTFIFLSTTVWTILLAAFLTFLYKDNYWFLFMIGIPIQIALVFMYNLRKTKNK